MMTFNYDITFTVLVTFFSYAFTTEEQEQNKDYRGSHTYPGMKGILRSITEQKDSRKIINST